MAAEFESTVDLNSGVSLELMAEVMGTTVTGMLLVAFVDGKLHWHEHQTLVESLRLIAPHATVDDLLKYLDGTAHLLEEIPRSGWPDLFEIGRKLPDRFKVTIMGMCTKVAFADGYLTIEESKLIHEIAAWINIDRDGRKLWKQGVRGAVKAAQLRGLAYKGIENLERAEEVNSEPSKIHESARQAYDLARTHYLGLGVTKDEQQGIRLFKRAAFMNYPDAQAMLGQIYRESENNKVGDAWTLVAASNGQTDAVRYIEEQGELPDDVKHLASRLIEAIQGLQLLVTMNPQAALAKLAEIENEDLYHWPRVQGP